MLEFDEGDVLRAKEKKLAKAEDTIGKFRLRIEEMGDLSAQIASVRRGLDTTMDLSAAVAAESPRSSLSKKYS